MLQFQLKLLNSYQASRYTYKLFALFSLLFKSPLKFLLLQIHIKLELLLFVLFLIMITGKFNPKLFTHILSLLKLPFPTLDCFASLINSLCSFYISDYYNYESLMQDFFHCPDFPWSSYTVCANPLYQSDILLNTVQSFICRKLDGYLCVPYKPNELYFQIALTYLAPQKYDNDPTCISHLVTLHVFTLQKCLFTLQNNIFQCKKDVIIVVSIVYNANNLHNNYNVFLALENIVFECEQKCITLQITMCHTFHHTTDHTTDHTVSHFWSHSKTIFSSTRKTL